MPDVEVQSFCSLRARMFPGLRRYVPIICELLGRIPDRDAAVVVCESRLRIEPALILFPSVSIHTSHYSTHPTLRKEFFYD